MIDDMDIHSDQYHNVMDRQTSRNAIAIPFVILRSDKKTGEN